MGTNRDFEYWAQEPTFMPDVQMQQNMQPQQMISPQPIIQQQSYIPQQLNIPQQSNIPQQPNIPQQLNIPQQMNIPQQPNNLQFMQPNQQYESSPAGQMYTANPYLNPNASGYTGSFYTPSTDYVGSETAAEGFEDEPPLLEELGINFGHIMQKTFTVLHPFRNISAEVAQDTDMAGPLVFCLAFGACLLLSGKVHFNYIYGLAVLGCCGMYALLALMSLKGTSFGIVISILGYSMIPMVGLAGLNIVLSLKGLVGILASAFSILWCALSASKLFVTALEMNHQQPLVAYPCALLYSVFALITVF